MDGVVQEDFEYICVAHNGKCAERLMQIYSAASAQTNNNYSRTFDSKKRP